MLTLNLIINPLFTDVLENNSLIDTINYQLYIN